MCRRRSGRRSAPLYCTHAHAPPQHSTLVLFSTLSPLSARLFDTTNHRYDVNSYSYRDVNGGAFHESMGKDYGEPYGPGDVIGCLIKMGDPPAAHRERQRVTLKGVEYIVEEEMKRTVSVGSSITFYKNGKTQSTAFTDVWAEVYYPAVSLYKASVVEFNFGPSFAFPPPSDLGSDVAKPVSDLATPPPKPEGVEAGGGESSKAGAEGENAGEEAEEAEGEGDEMDDAM